MILFFEYVNYFFEKKEKCDKVTEEAKKKVYTEITKKNEHREENEDETHL